MTSKDLESYIESFLNKIDEGKIEVYSEANLECRLAQYLLYKVPNEFKVESQRNVNFFDLDKHDFIKKEMDIVIYNEDRSIKYEIELKYPTTSRNAAYPDNLKMVIEDIMFTESLRKNGFTDTYFLIISDDYRVYSKVGIHKELKTDGIYGYFRDKKVIDNKSFDIKGSYIINWQGKGDIKYYFGKTNNKC